MQIANINTNEKINMDFDYNEENLIAYGYNPDEWKTVPENFENNFVKWDGETWLEDVELANQKLQEAINVDAVGFLNETDWKVIRHRDQLDQGLETSLSSNEYQELLLIRQQKRELVK